MLIFLFLIPLILSAQCNASNTEQPIGQDLSIAHSVNNYGRIWAHIVTANAIYISCQFGERVKIDTTNISVVWAIDFYSSGFAMDLSLDESYLLAEGSFS